MAMDPISFATSFYPATLMVLNAAVAMMLLMRRRAVAETVRRRETASAATHRALKDPANRVKFCGST